MKPLIERLLLATAIAHTIVGVVFRRKPLKAIAADGFFNSVDPHFDRQAAFWFLLFSPALLLLRQVTIRAFDHQDTGTLRIVGWNLLGIGFVGAAAMPMSGFWILMAIAGLLLRAARRVEGDEASLAPEPVARGQRSQPSRLGSV